MEWRNNCIIGETANMVTASLALGAPELVVAWQCWQHQ